MRRLADVCDHCDVIPLSVILQIAVLSYQDHSASIRGLISASMTTRTSSCRNARVRMHRFHTSISTQSSSSACKLPLDGEVLGSEGKQFHVRCFNCQHCGCVYFLCDDSHSHLAKRPDPTRRSIRGPQRQAHVRRVPNAHMQGACIVFS